MPLKLASLIAGAFGILGLVLSILAGLAVSNSVESILIHSLVCGLVCYLVGYGVGLIAQQVSREKRNELLENVSKELVAAKQTAMSKAWKQEAAPLIQ